MKFLGLDRVLCLSPHPDDVEYGMSGTVWKHPETAFTVFTMSVGSRGDEGSDIVRQQEVTSFWGDSVTVRLRAGHFYEKEETGVCQVETDGYDAILVPPERDSHFEHAMTNRIGRALTRDRPIALIEYCTVSTHLDWTPNLMVDIGREFERKRGALHEAFTSQEDRAYFRGPVLDTFHRNMQAGKKGILYVERFRLVEVYR